MIKRKKILFITRKMKRLCVCASALVGMLCSANVVASANVKHVHSQRPQTEVSAKRPKRVNQNTYWHNRIVPFSKQRKQYRYPNIEWNFRDTGNYYAGHGMYTKRRTVYRGGSLHYISKNGIKRLKQLHVKQVIDLRDGDHQVKPDPSEFKRHNPLGVKYSNDVVNTHSQKRYWNRLAKYRGGERYKYRTSFLTSRQARHAYRQVFNQLLHRKHGAIYYHCTCGEDRTGIVSILYLSALGVNKRTIYNDYMLTDYYDHKHTYADEVAQINSFYWGIHRYYGNMNNYLHKGVGLTSHQISRLRHMYLVRAVQK